METEPQQCAERVYKADGNWGRTHQCARKAGHGPDGRYCTQHAEKFTEGDTVTWYRASRWTDYSCGIVEVQVLKETDGTLLIKNGNKARREKKTSESYIYFPTPADAIEFYKGRAAGLQARAQAFEKQVNALEHRYCGKVQP